jgi:hypothetical protein
MPGAPTWSAPTWSAPTCQPTITIRWTQPCRPLGVRIWRNPSCSPMISISSPRSRRQTSEDVSSSGTSATRMKRYAIARRSTPGAAGARNRSGSRATARPASDAIFDCEPVPRSHGGRMEPPGVMGGVLGSVDAERTAATAVRKAPAGQGRHRRSSDPRRRRTGNNPSANTSTPKAVVSDQAATGRATPGSAPKTDSARTPCGTDRGARSRPCGRLDCPSPGPEDGPGVATTACPLGDSDGATVAEARAAGRGDRVGRGVAFGLVRGFAVGRGVALGDGDAGFLITTRLGETAASVADRSPDPEPLTAVNRYDHRPTGNRLASRNVTPLANVVPPARIRYRPTPGMTTSTRDGAHPTLST